MVIGSYHFPFYETWVWMMDIQGPREKARKWGTGCISERCLTCKLYSKRALFSIISIFIVDHLTTVNWMQRLKPLQANVLASHHVVERRLDFQNSPNHAVESSMVYRFETNWNPIRIQGHGFGVKSVDPERSPRESGELGLVTHDRSSCNLAK